MLNVQNSMTSEHLILKTPNLNASLIMIFSSKKFPRKLDRIVLTSFGNTNVRMNLSKRSQFPFMENFIFIPFENYQSVLMYLISSHKLESIISRISTLKCSSLLGEIDVSKFTRQEANDPVSIRTRVCRPLIQSHSVSSNCS